MGAELSIAALWIRRDREPDWSGAAGAIRDLPLATVWDTGDDFFPWEAWLEDAPNPPDPLGVLCGLRAAQSYLAEALADTREAVERGVHDMLVAELPEHRVFAAGYVSAGDLPDSPFSAFCAFGEGGLAAAAGFEGWTRCCAIDLPGRELDFRPDERRSVAATRALMFAEDLAAERRLRDEFTYSDPQQWSELWLAPLRQAARLRRTDRVLPVLVDFAATTYALLDELWGLAPSPSDASGLRGVSPIAYETCGVLGTDALPAISPEAPEVMLEARAAAEAFGPMIDLVAGPGDPATGEQIERLHGRPLPQAVAVEVVSELLAPMVVAIADLAGDELPAVAAPRSRQGRREPPWRRGRLVHPEYEAYLGWCAAPALDLQAARDAVDQVEDPGLRDQLRSDLEPFAVITNDEYSRLVTSERVGDLTVWFTAESWGDGWTLNAPLRRLGAAGVLKAAGAVAWSAPSQTR